MEHNPNAMEEVELLKTNEVNDVSVFVRIIATILLGCLHHGAVQMIIAVSARRCNLQSRCFFSQLTEIFLA